MRAALALLLAGCAATSTAPAMRHTRVSIRGDAFLINDRPTYAGRPRVEGLLLNSRMVQATFDDLNPETAKRWAYPDTGRWDPERNVREFLAALPEYRRHGLLAVTLNLQGGSPEGYSKAQPWENSAFAPDGSLRPAYLSRLARVLDRLDELGMVAILGLFYFGQDERLADEAAVLRAADAALAWLKAGGWTNVLVEANNECNVKYDHAILRPDRIHELVERARAAGFLAGTSYGGGTIPRENVVRASDFLLLHGNGVGDPAKITDMVRKTRQVPGYRPMPILFNEDDHFDFDKPANNFAAAVAERAGWGYFDPGKNNHLDGYQSPPVRWDPNTERKRSFFAKVKELAGE
jgi:hypothetical protein